MAIANSLNWKLLAVFFNQHGDICFDEVVCPCKAGTNTLQLIAIGENFNYSKLPLTKSDKLTEH